MITWTGRGYLVFLIVLVCSLIANYIFDAVFGPGYYAGNKSLIAVSLIVSGVICWPLGKYLRKRADRVLIDKQTGEEVVINQSRHTFMWIPMDWWGQFFVASALVLLVTEFAITPYWGGLKEFRFVHEKTTGLANSVCTDGKRKTSIVITKDSDPESVALLDALIATGIHGTNGGQFYMGVKWEQTVMLVGEFVSEPKRTEGAPDASLREAYRDFRVKDIKVIFPLSRLETAQGANQIGGSKILVTHFSFASILPNGVALHGKPIDLGRHASGRKSYR